MEHATLAIRKAKRAATVPIYPSDDLRTLRRLAREKDPKSVFVFASETARRSPAGLARMVERAGVVAGCEFKAHPHILRPIAVGVRPREDILHRAVVIDDLLHGKVCQLLIGIACKTGDWGQYRGQYTRPG